MPYLSMHNGSWYFKYGPVDGAADTAFAVWPLKAKLIFICKIELIFTSATPLQDHSGKFFRKKTSLIQYDILFNLYMEVFSICAYIVEVLAYYYC